MSFQSFSNSIVHYTSRARNSKEKHEDVMLDCYPCSNDGVVFTCDISIFLYKKGFFQFLNKLIIYFIFKKILSSLYFLIF